MKVVFTDLADDAVVDTVTIGPGKAVTSETGWAENIVEQTVAELGPEAASAMFADWSNGYVSSREAGGQDG